MKGVISMGINCPIIREGDYQNLPNIIVDSVADEISGAGFTLNHNDVIGITESVVARAFGQYVTVDEVSDEIKHVMKNPETIILYNCIYSRNRFAMILKAIARAAGKTVQIYMPDFDEVGNPCANHPFTGLDYTAYYREIVEAEGKTCIIERCSLTAVTPGEKLSKLDNAINCCLHDFNISKREWPNIFTLTDFCKSKCEYGLLGSNKSTEERLKLFPDKNSAKSVCDDVKKIIKDKFDTDVIVCVYGDGCFHSPTLNDIPGTSINEFADPVSLAAYTDSDIIESCPNEGKLKYYADTYTNLSKEEILDKIEKDKGTYSVGKDVSEGCTPRRRDALLASLMDLTSGSGDRGTPVVLVKNYI